MKEINLTIAGGCFPVQNNIATENLYHQILRRELKERYNSELKINIIRYERFAGCFEKIEEYESKNRTDVLLFHIRSEQFLRVCKLYYKYSDRNKIKRDLTISFLNRIPPEDKELLMMSMPLPNENQSQLSALRKCKVYSNLAAGIIFGNRKFALRKYSELLERVNNFCEEKKIKLIIAGPASRPNLAFEDKLTSDLSEFFRRKAGEKNIPFINLTGYINENKEPLFFKNGIHVSKAGHKRAADLLAVKFKEILLT